MLPVEHVSFFFFQAEDGIRDLTVTGVQTCALPISMTLPARHGLRRAPARRELERLLGAAIRTPAARVSGELGRAQSLEELPQAVGKERGHEIEKRQGDHHCEETDHTPFA